jgi:Protein of unknown function (DUF1153)
MAEGNKRGTYAVGPNGFALTLATLPPFKGTRWVARRKAEIVIAVGGGIITLSEACERYAISSDEFLEWERALTQNGTIGLHALGRIRKSAIAPAI